MILNPSRRKWQPEFILIYTNEAGIQPKGMPKAKSFKSLLERSGQSSRVYPSALQIKQMIAESRQRSLMGEKG